MSVIKPRMIVSGAVLLWALAGWAIPVVGAQSDGPSAGASDSVAGGNQENAAPDAEPGEAGSPSDATTAAPSAPGSADSGSRLALLIASLTIFVLAIFVGFEVITKVPPTLHTPLMSGSNAISGITIVGALIVAGHGLGIDSFVGFLAVLLAAINVVGGFLVTHRMLAMFKKR